MTHKPLLRFFGLTLVFSWSVWLIGILIGGTVAFAFFPLEVWGPALSAFMVTAKGERRSLFRSARPHWLRVPWLWYATLAAPVAMAVPLLGNLITEESTGPSFLMAMVPRELRMVAYLSIPVTFVVLWFTNLGEEWGWRGYALAPTIAWTSPLVASLIIGILNSLWHAPLFWLLGNPVYNPFSVNFVGFVLFEVGYTIVVTIVWLNSGRTVFARTFVSHNINTLSPHLGVACDATRLRCTVATDISRVVRPIP